MKSTKMECLFCKGTFSAGRGMSNHLQACPSRQIGGKKRSHRANKTIKERPPLKRTNVRNPQQLNWKSFTCRIQNLKISQGLNNSILDEIIDLIWSCADLVAEIPTKPSARSIETENLSSIHCRALNLGPIKVLKHEFNPYMYVLNARQIAIETLERVFFQDPDLLVENYFNPVYEPEATFNELRSGNWFQQATSDVFKNHPQPTATSTGQCCDHDSIEQSAGVLALILYTDGTAVGMFGSHSMKPIYMALGNGGKKDYRSTIQTIAFFPELEGTFADTKELPESREAKRMLLNKTWDTILSTLELETPFEFRGITVYLKIAFIAGDHPEQQRSSMCFEPSSTQFPCRFCFEENKNLNWLGPYPAESFAPIARTPDNIYRLFRREKVIEADVSVSQCFSGSKSYPINRELSMHPEVPVWSVRGVFSEDAGIYWHTPMCTMHNLSLGISKYVVACVVDMVEANGYPSFANLENNVVPEYYVLPNMDADNGEVMAEQETEEHDVEEQCSEDEDVPEQEAVEPGDTDPRRGARYQDASKRKKRAKKGPQYKRLQEFDKRMASLPSFSDKTGDYLKRFKKGISNLTFLSATEYDAIIRVLPFVVRNSDGFLMDDVLNSKVVDCLLELNCILQFVRKDFFTDEDLKHFSSVTLREFRQKLISTFGCLQTSSFNLIKVHMLQHLEEMIRKFGSPLNYDTCFFEEAHKKIKVLWGVYKGPTMPERVLKSLEFYRVNISNKLSTAENDQGQAATANECCRGTHKTSAVMTNLQAQKRYGEEYFRFIFERFSESQEACRTETDEESWYIDGTCQSCRIHYCKKEVDDHGGCCYDNWIHSKWTVGDPQDIISTKLHFVSERDEEEQLIYFYRVSMFLVARKIKESAHQIFLVGEQANVIDGNDPVLRCPKVAIGQTPEIYFIPVSSTMRREFVIKDFDWFNNDQKRQAAEDHKKKKQQLTQEDDTAGQTAEEFQFVGYVVPSSTYSNASFQEMELALCDDHE
jgi:hypothetical protein